MRNLIQAFRNTSSGSTLIEFSILLPILLTMTFGIIDFGYVLHQYNNAQKATQAGVRLASTSLVLQDVDDCFVVVLDRLLLDVAASTRLDGLNAELGYQLVIFPSRVEDKTSRCAPAAFFHHHRRCKRGRDKQTRK